MRRIVFHHNDNDGKAAAAVIYQAYELFTDGSIDKFISVNYNDSIPTPELVEEGDVVYIVDYSFTKATVQNLIDISKKADRLYWFDHHLSSLEVYDDIIKDNICSKAIVDTERCGALITLDYFKHLGLICNNSAYILDKIIKYVDDYDRWIHKYPESILFNIGSQMRDTNPTSLLWVTDPIYSINDGRLIKQYNDKKNSNIVKKDGFVIKINGHECIVLNTPEASSQAFAEYYEKYKFAIRFAFNGKNYKYSIYSDLEDINCAELAKRFNPKGGGHKGAAGFVSDKLHFVNGQVFVI